MVTVEDLHFAYPDGRQALQGISFHLAAGETVGLVGPNGAGKSTLLQHLNGLLGAPCQRGRVAIDGLPVEAAHLPEIRRRVGYLFQDPDDQLFSSTVGEDVAFGPRQLGLPEPQVASRVAAALEAVHLRGFEARPPHHLSLGEKKRVCLAGVWACEPSVLVFDEPTANFDPRGRREFIALCRTLKATKIIASHDLEMILALCDRLLLLDGGQLVTQGTAREILANESLMLAHGLEKPHSLVPHEAHRHPH